MKKVKNLTKKLKLVESSKSEKLEKTLKAAKTEKVEKVVKTKKTKKIKQPTKKRLLIIESTSSSQPKTFVKKEEKNETNLINNGDNKTYLKISQDLNKMSPSHIELPSGRLNEKFSDLMGKLADIMSKQGETFRARAYQKAQETIMSYPGDIMSANDLKGKPNIGPTIMEKLNEYSQTGTL